MTPTYDNTYKTLGAYHWDHYFNGENPGYIRETNLTLRFFYGKSGRVLDIGCGDGVLLYLLNGNPNLSCLGIDSSPEAISLARERGVLNCMVLDIGSVEATGVHDYDYVIMADTLEHIQDHNAALDTVLFLMAPEGRFLFVAPKQGDPLPLDCHVFSKNDLWAMLRSRFDIAEAYETQTHMRFICMKKGRNGNSLP